MTDCVRRKIFGDHFFFSKKSVNPHDFKNPLHHEHECTSRKSQKSSWAQTDHIALADTIHSVSF